MPREGYVSITLRKSTWQRMQELKKILNVNTYDELIDKIYELLIKGGTERLLEKITNLENNLENLNKEIGKIYEIEKILDNTITELENLKIIINKLQARIEVLEKRK
ncbi:MAG: hypothetical protein B6V02_01385 [Thermoprotei archaeon ex4572_64]|nr:MAG: hypothetical protein B6V02_01385 [Thermoprotei archaeon ex4572_64]